MTEDELRQIQEQAHLLDELTKHPGWPVLVDYALTKIARSKEAVLNGNIDDHATYKARTGVFVGVHFVLDAPREVRDTVLSELERREEDAETDA